MRYPGSGSIQKAPAINRFWICRKLTAIIPNKEAFSSGPTQVHQHLFKDLHFAENSPTVLNLFLLKQNVYLHLIFEKPL